VLAALKEAGIGLLDLTAQTVEENAHRNPVLGVYARWATANKIVSTYGDSLRARVNPGTGRIHGDFNQIVSTGRTSSREPNMQNMPKKIRACFKPAPSKRYVVADFAAMELSIAAGLSGDPVMIEAFNEGKDLHRMTAAAAWPGKFSDWTQVPKDSDERALAKTANFASIYGSSARGLVTRGVIDDLATAEEVITGISTLYKTMWSWLRATGEQATRLYYAETALGRKRYFQRLGPKPRDPELAEEWRRQRGGIKRQAQNHPVQGTGADIAKRAMVLIAEELADRGDIVCMVHDEVVVECPTEHTEAVSELVLRSMEKAGAELVQGVPITADVHVVSCWEK
jgi:DNA polymerase I-like protein with 3'-5' exonuclease and polymerase domains